MNNKENFEVIDYLLKLKELENFDTNLITKFKRISIASKFADLKEQYPNMKQNELCKSIGTSSSSMQRIRKDLNMNSPFKYEICVKRSAKKKEKVPRQVPEQTTQKIKRKKNKVELAGSITKEGSQTILEEIEKLANSSN